MKSLFSSMSASAFIAVAGVVASTSSAAVNVTVDPAAPWQGFMNVSNLPSPDGDGAYQFGSPWGVADLTASFSGSVVTLGPNTIGDPNAYWYIGGGAPGNPGNKIMDANLYVEDSVVSLSGQTVNFGGNVIANTFAPGYTTVAFIRDFAPDFSSVVQVTAPLINGNFILSLDTINDPARHVQYGFQTIGRNVWFTDVGPIGNAQIGPLAVIPEPASLALIAAAPLVLRRRR
jgi:hypothetical protein